MEQGEERFRDQHRNNAENHEPHFMEEERELIRAEKENRRHARRHQRYEIRKYCRTRFYHAVKPSPHTTDLTNTLMKGMKNQNTTPIAENNTK